VLQGKRIAVTDAFGALGAVVMRAVAAAGASAAGIARAPASKAPAQLGGFALSGGADMSEAASAEATPLLSANGRVICIGAAGAAKAGVGMGPYAASKAGVAKLVEALAEEVKDRNITVNAILPSIIDTPANRADMPDADFSRWVRPERVANLIVFLLSDRASAITGALIPILGRV
jgi:hypothetical protein